MQYGKAIVRDGEVVDYLHRFSLSSILKDAGIIAAVADDAEDVGAGLLEPLGYDVLPCRYVGEGSSVVSREIVGGEVVITLEPMPEV